MPVACQFLLPIFHLSKKTTSLDFIPTSTMSQSGSQSPKYTQHKTPLPVPDLEGVTHPQGQDLSEKQQAYYQKVLDHFSKVDYKLPEVDDGVLADEEKYWLVCLSCPTRDASRLNRMGVRIFHKSRTSVCFGMTSLCGGIHRVLISTPTHQIPPRNKVGFSRSCNQET